MSKVSAKGLGNDAIFNCYLFYITEFFDNLFDNQNSYIISSNFYNLNYNGVIYKCCASKINILNRKQQQWGVWSLHFNPSDYDNTIGDTS